MYLDNYVVTGTIEPRELKKIEEDCRSAELKSITAEVVGESEFNEDTRPRRGKVYWLTSSENKKSVSIFYSYLLESYVNVTNVLDLSSHFPEIQYAVYYKGDFFRKHKDNIPRQDYVRTLTMSVNITDKKDYEGGLLRIYSPQDPDNNIELNKEKGSFIIFPSFYTHEVTPITKGKRESVVVWANQDRTRFNKFMSTVI